MPAKVYTDKDADLAVLKNKTVAVIGYGSQGHAHALNLKDSGVNVIIGLYKGSKSASVARKQGFKVYLTAQAVKRADVIMVALPDMVQADVYKSDIEPNLKKGKTLLFSHGLAVHFGLIKLPEEVDCIMVAPKGPGHMVRRLYQEGKGMPALIAVDQNPSRKAKKTALAWAKGMGWRFGNHFQGRDRNGSLWRTSRALRWRQRARAGWIRNARRGGLSTGDGLLRVLT